MHLVFLLTLAGTIAAALPLVPVWLVALPAMLQLLAQVPPLHPSGWAWYAPEAFAYVHSHLAPAHSSMPLAAGLLLEGATS